MPIAGLTLRSARYAIGGGSLCILVAFASGCERDIRCKMNRELVFSNIGGTALTVTAWDEFCDTVADTSMGVFTDVEPCTAQSATINASEEARMYWTYSWWDKNRCRCAGAPILVEIYDGDQLVDSFDAPKPKDVGVYFDTGDIPMQTDTVKVER